MMFSNTRVYIYRHSPHTVNTFHIGELFFMSYHHENDDEQFEVGRGWVIAFIVGAIFWCCLLLIL